MPLISAGLTDIGRKRKTNQDAIYLNKEKKLFIVADGMGGHRGGDIASAMAIKYIPEQIASRSHHNPVQKLKDSIGYSNAVIRGHALNNPKLVGMGTTVLTLHFHQGIAYIGNVGDSRSYLIQNHLLYQLTRDHGLVQEKIDLGLYSRQEAYNDPNKNVLVRTVGFEEEIEVDVFSYKVYRNDIFIQCSDGLYSKVHDQDLVYVINRAIPNPSQAQEGDLHQALKSLVDLANENGGQDNISIILVVAQ